MTKNHTFLTNTLTSIYEMPCGDIGYKLALVQIGELDKLEKDIQGLERLSQDEAMTKVIVLNTLENYRKHYKLNLKLEVQVLDLSLYLVLTFLVMVYFVLVMTHRLT